MKHRRLFTLLNLGLALALVLAIMPTQGIQAATKDGDQITLIYPDSGTACIKFAKFMSLSHLNGMTVEYALFSWASGSPVQIGTVVAPMGQAVKIDYPDGIGNGMYAVTATYFDANGVRIHKKGAKWTLVCEKGDAPRVKK